METIKLTVHCRNRGSRTYSSTDHEYIGEDLANRKIGPPSTPDVLLGVRKTLIRALDPSDALHATLSIINHKQVSGPVIALGAVASYFEAAKRQQRRIERAKAGPTKKVTARTRSLFDEVHFYLICWARIAKLTRFIARCTRFRRTGLVLRRYHAELTERVNGRDHLEHFEERLPGGPRRHDLAVPGDLLNMAGYFLTYGGRKIDVGPASVLLLRAIVTEFSHCAIIRLGRSSGGRRSEPGLYSSPPCRIASSSGPGSKGI